MAGHSISRITDTLALWFEAYTKCVSERIKMAAEDGQRLAEEAQKTALKMTKSLGGAEGST